MIMLANWPKCDNLLLTTKMLAYHLDMQGLVSLRWYSDFSKVFEASFEEIRTHSNIHVLAGLSQLSLC